MRFYRRLTVKLINVILLLLPCISWANTQGFTFQVISDIPYNSDQAELLTTSIIPEIQQGNGAFLMHLGDIKGGGEPCIDEKIIQKLRQVKDMHPVATFYTPGDNEWTDCDNKRTGKPVSELEKLDLIRQFYRENFNHYPETLQVKTQALFPENKQWFYQDVAFATLHVVGSNNGRTHIDQDDVAFTLSQVVARDSANAYWLKNLFSQAEKNNAQAVIVGIQADINDSPFSTACTADNARKCDGFLALKQQLISLSSSFKKPVLLMHGDTAPYCLDNTLGGKNAPNLWRFNSAGDYLVLDAVTVTVDTSNNAMPFSMATLMSHQPPVMGCK